VQAIALTKTALPLPSSQARVAVWSGLLVSVHSWKASAATRALHSCARAASPIHGYEWPQRRNGIRRLTNSAPYRLWGKVGKNRVGEHTLPPHISDIYDYIATRFHEREYVAVNFRHGRFVFVNIERAEIVYVLAVLFYLEVLIILSWVPPSAFIVPLAIEKVRIGRTRYTERNGILINR
jgi:hypothetical protein